MSQETLTKELNVRLRLAYQQIKQGKVYTQEEAHKIMDDFVQSKICVQN